MRNPTNDSRSSDAPSATRLDAATTLRVACESARNACVKVCEGLKSLRGDCRDREKCSATLRLCDSTRHAASASGVFDVAVLPDSSRGCAASPCSKSTRRAPREGASHVYRSSVSPGARTQCARAYICLRSGSLRSIRDAPGNAHALWPTRPRRFRLAILTTCARSDARRSMRAYTRMGNVARYVSRHAVVARLAARLEYRCRFSATQA